MHNFSFRPFPELNTTRLRLRQLQPTDENELLAVRSNEEVNRYIDRPVDTTLDDVRQTLQRLTNMLETGNGIMWAITLTGSDKLIGTACLFHFNNEKNSGEIGYELLPAYQGRGLMQEAVTAVLAFGFGQLQLACIDAVVMPANRASVKLLQRNGFILSQAANEVSFVTYSLMRDKNK